MTGRLIRVGEIDPAEVDCGDRLRPVSEQHVQSLMVSMREVGQQAEVHIRQIRHQDNRLKLIIGGHRMEALKRLKFKANAKFWDCTDDFARMMEIDDNLAHADLSPLDLAIFLAERKAVYERMYPQSKATAFRGNRHTGSLANDIVSFTSSVAVQRDMSKRQIERLVAAGQGLDTMLIEQLRSAPQRPTLADLQVIAKCNGADEKAQVCAALAEGQVKTAAQALARLAGGQKAEKPSKHDAEFRALNDAFSRASKAVQRRFVEANADTLRALLADAETTGEVVAFKRRGGSS